MTPTTDQLKDLLAKVTQGEWRWYDYDDCKDGNVTSGRLQADEPVIWHCECVSLPDASLIALAPTLAAEVVRLRAALSGIIVEYVQSREDAADVSYEMAHIARQALDATSEK